MKTPELIEDLGMIYATSKSTRKRHYYLYQCPTCDNNFKAMKSDIKNGKIIQCKTCRIKNRTTHGMSRTPLYQCWADMKDRCYNPNNKRFKHYGGRGITVCDEWMNFKNFHLWAMVSGYKDTLTIERKNNDGNYNEDNCKWATYTMQNQNNKLLRANNTSGYRGVDEDKRSGKYRARIQVNKEVIELGLFETKIEASQVRDNYIIENNLSHPLNRA